MLPFLDKKKTSVAGLIIKNRTPDEKPEENQDDSHTMAIEACAEDLINAVHAKDTKAVAAALKDAFEVLQNQPQDMSQPEGVE